jgi:hypothetical protein
LDRAPQPDPACLQRLLVWNITSPLASDEGVDQLFLIN